MPQRLKRSQRTSPRRHKNSRQQPAILLGEVSEVVPRSAGAGEGEQEHSCGAPMRNLAVMRSVICITAANQDALGPLNQAAMMTDGEDCSLMSVISNKQSGSIAWPLTQDTPIISFFFCNFWFLFRINKL